MRFTYIVFLWLTPINYFTIFLTSSLYIFLPFSPPSHFHTMPPISSTIQGRIDQVESLLELQMSTSQACRHQATLQWTHRLSCMHEAVVAKMPWVPSSAPLSINSHLQAFNHLHFTSIINHSIVFIPLSLIYCTKISLTHVSTFSICTSSSEFNQIQFLYIRF